MGSVLIASPGPEPVIISGTLFSPEIREKEINSVVIAEPSCQVEELITESEVRSPTLFR